MLIDTTHYYYYELEDKICGRLLPLCNQLGQRPWLKLALALPAQHTSCINDQVRRILKEYMYVK